MARLRTHGQDLLTEVVVKAADHVCRRFMNGTETCGHPVIEMALVELYRATGTERYLEMARRFVERRGLPALADIPFGRGYYQDDVPVRQAQVFRGHVVRALYLASGVVDVAVETGDQELLKAVEAQWERTVARRTHLTGGMGSRHADESYGEDYELPPDRAYNETCASIASVMLAHRLLLATGDVRYADLTERTLYNMLATGVALDGRSFFYANPLQVRVPAVPHDGVNHAAEGGLRSPWFDVSCCPNNIARTLASLPAYLAAGTGDGIVLHHFTPSEIRHGRLAVRVETGYPWTGSVRVRVLEDGAGRIGLRVPAWAADATLARVPVSAQDAPLPDGPVVRPASPGYVHVEGPWRAGDELRLELPMRPRWTFPDRRIDALRGSAAVERGPLVYCAESVADEPPLGDLTVRTEPPVERPAGDGAEGVVELEVTASIGGGSGVSGGSGGSGGSGDGGGWPYGAAGAPEDGADVRLRLVPYHRWGNRGPATMRVWLPTIPPAK